MIGFVKRALTGKSAAQQKLKEHLRGIPVEKVVTAARTATGLSLFLRRLLREPGLSC